MSKQILNGMLGRCELTRIKVAILITFFTCMGEQMENGTDPYGNQGLSLQDGNLMY